MVGVPKVGGRHDNISQMAAEKEINRRIRLILRRPLDRLHDGEPSAPGLRAITNQDPSDLWQPVIARKAETVPWKEALLPPKWSEATSNRSN